MLIIPSMPLALLIHRAQSALQRWAYHYPYFTDGETEAQVTAEVGLEPRSSELQVSAVAILPQSEHDAGGSQLLYLEGKGSRYLLPRRAQVH